MTGTGLAVKLMNTPSGAPTVNQRQEVAMSGMVLTQLLNPESGIDRPGADKALDGAGQGRPDNGPSRYDEVVRQQEKRLEQRRAQERDVQQKRQEARQQEARQQEAHQQKTARQDDKAAKTAPDDRPAENSTQAANERRTDTDKATGTRGASGQAEDNPETHTARQPDPSEKPGPSEKPDGNTDQPAIFELVESMDAGDETGIPGLALQGQSPDKKLLAPQGDFPRSTTQVMASLTGTSQKPGGLPTTGALFAAMLEAGQEKGKQGRELMAGLQGTSLQSLTDTTAKAADTLTAQVASRLTAPEFSQSLNQAASLRGADAQALMRNYSTSVDVPVGADEWGEKVMGKLAWLTASQMSVAEIHITPPDMGPLDVRVQVQNDQAVVTVHATTPAVREQLELHGHRLRDMLNEQGLSLEGFDVSDSPGREAADQQGEGDESGNARSGQSLAGNDTDGDADTMETGELDLSWKGELDLYA